ncbi:hypothetical protein [Leptonema illini]|uniref:Lipoprotein n=1 Tax=Leptonema illini DSM 21528 TaxID=929563 RepID=H2CAK8_9LEPT|nr:hypothetical protein [Leptonema illini]EHQ08386.1 hypothetical protein Lepil_3731 [Leptonema illini DSM 21528]
MQRIPLLFILIATLVACEKTAEQEAPQIPLCDIHSGLCEGRLDDGTVVRFDITPKPVKALEALQFSVYVDGVSDAKVSVDLAMPAMYMGENKVALVPTGDGNYSGKGSVVKCTSGDRLWDAAVTIERAGKPSTIHFRFETAP